MLEVYKKLIRYVPEKKGLLIGTVCCSFLSALLQISAFYYLNVFLREIILGGDRADPLRYAIYISGLLFCAGISYFISLSISHIFAFRLETNLRKYGIEGLSNASFSFFDLNPSGKIRKIIDDNAAATHMAVAHLIPDNTGAMLMPILILCLSFTIRMELGFIIVIFIILSGFSLAGMIGDKAFMKLYTESLEVLSAETVEYVRGIQVIKIFGVDVRSFKALNAAIKGYASNALKYSISCKRPYVIFQSLFFGIIAIITPLIVIFIGFDAAPKLMAADLIMLFLLSGVLFTYIMKIMYVSMYVFQAKDAVERLEKLYNSMGEDSISFGSKTEFEGYDIEFDNVSFSYDEKPVLDNLSFKLQSGRSYALVGESGSGKSTIAKLISGFYRVNGGSIKIGQSSIEDYDKDTLISNIAFVFQDAKLFKKSIYDNVAMAKKGATKEEVLNAMKLAGCESIIAKFETGIDTMIGSKGVYLSGGEKQKIAIARAILKDAKIVIFDEASAALDPENEHELQKAFANLMRDKTVIMIAHRLTSIKNLDEILVIKEGKIVERGSNDTLMAQGGLYKQLQDMYAQANDWRLADETIS